MDDTEALLAAFDEQARAEPPVPPAGVWHEPDGPVLRVVGQERGFIAAPRDTGARGAGLDQLIARQRDYFAARGEAVEWKTYGYDEPPDLPDRLRAAGFVPEDTEAVVVALASAIAAEPVLPGGVVLRQVTAAADMRRIAAMESQVWATDRGWTGDYLIREIAAAPDDFIVLTAEAAGQVVAAGWLAFRPGNPVRRPVGRRDPARVAGPGDLPCPGRPPRPARRRPGGALPPGRRLQRQRPDPPPARLRAADHHNPLCLDPAGLRASCSHCPVLATPVGDGPSHAVPWRRHRPASRASPRHARHAQRVRTS